MALGELVYAHWSQRVYKVHAYFYNQDAVIADRGVYSFNTRTEEDTDWQWLSRQLDEERVVFGDVCASDLLYTAEHNGGIVIGRDPVFGSIRLMLVSVN